MYNTYTVNNDNLTTVINETNSDKDYNKINT